MDEEELVLDDVSKLIGCVLVADFTELTSDRRTELIRKLERLKIKKTNNFSEKLHLLQREMLSNVDLPRENGIIIKEEVNVMIKNHLEKRLKELGLVKEIDPIKEVTFNEDKYQHEIDWTEGYLESLDIPLNPEGRTFLLSLTEFLLGRVK